MPHKMQNKIRCIPPKTKSIFLYLQGVEIKDSTVATQLGFQEHRSCEAPR